MKLTGIGASEGIAFAKIFKLEKKDIVISDEKANDLNIEAERIKSALNKTVEQIKGIKDRSIGKLTECELAIFDAHIEIINDPELYDQTVEHIEINGCLAEKAFEQVTTNFINIFEAMDNDYMKERASDIRDVSRRVLCTLLYIKETSLSELDEEVIVVSRDLTPSDTAQLDKRYVKGFATEIGGRTSHSAIMARTLEIPAVVGIGDFLHTCKDGEKVILDGISGCLVINPEKLEIDNCIDKIVDYEKKRRNLLEFKDMETTTADGRIFELSANIGSVDDVEGVISNGAEGIGLFRTEFLFMGREECPCEETQFNAYKTVLQKMDGKPVIIRTLDIGGDKKIDYINLSDELNPFLGHRAVRLCFERKDLFKTQLRALLRASMYGNLRIMFPMIATLSEFRMAKDLLNGCRCELENEGCKVDDGIEVGIMVEIPSAAMLADKFAKEVDFFSIGTNDLIQYTFAADRMNEKVSYLYQPFNPSLLRLIKNVIDASHKEGKWTGMCGEMAGNRMAIPLLAGLGLDEFSMSASGILEARRLLSTLEIDSLIRIAELALDCSTSKEVKELIQNELK